MMQSRVWGQVVLLVALAALVAGGCQSDGTSAGAGGEAATGKKLLSQKKLVGSEGGKLSLDDASIDVPAGALSEDTELSVSVLLDEERDALAALPAGLLFRSKPAVFEPHGLMFDQPVAVSLAHFATASELPYLGVFKLDDAVDTTWERVDREVGYSDGRAAFTVNSFSVYVVVLDSAAMTSMGTGGGSATGTGGGEAGGSSTGGLGPGGAASGGAASGGAASGGAASGGAASGGAASGGAGTGGVGGTGGGTSACAHSGCETGDALEVDCDPCVATVCGNNAPCCSTGWDQSCVDAVYALCSGSAPPAEGTSSCDYSVLADGGTIDTGAMSVLTGNLYGWGTVTFNALEPTTVNSVVCGDDVVAQPGATQINGDVRAAGTISANLSVDGTQTPGDLAIPNVNLSTVALDCSGVVNLSDPGSIDPGNYGSLTLSAGQTATFEEGLYNFNSFSIADGVTFDMPAVGNVDIRVCATADLGDNFAVTGLTGGADMLRFRLYADTSATLGVGANFYGVLQSQDIVAQGGNVQGLLWSVGNFAANQSLLTVDPGAYTRQQCLAAGLDAGGVWTCPVP